MAPHQAKATSICSSHTFAMIDDGDTYYDDEKRGQKLVIEMGKRIGKNGATSSGRGQ